MTFFLKSNLKIYCNPSIGTSHIDNVKKILNSLNLNFLSVDLNTLNNRSYDKEFIINGEFVLLHFDEKWINEKYF